MMLAGFPRPWSVVHIRGGRFAVVASNGAQVLRQSPAVELTESEARELCDLVNGQQGDAPEPGSDTPQTPGAGSWS
jgi:hypothetical protein